MALRLYNTLSRTAQEFQPIDVRTVRMYVCGPTVYDDPHIGHARSAYIFDVLRRYLECKKFPVRFVRNITDVDDKIIQKANAAGQSPETVAAQYIESYHNMLDRLGIARATEEPSAEVQRDPSKPGLFEPPATKHIDEMVNLISQLVVNGSAYETKSGDVYFSVRKFPGYGKLSNRTLDALQAGARIEPGEHKQDPLDFALWKAAKPGEPSWSSPWGEGRPGWHIECSAMSTKYLGDAFDIHGGGVDLVFPHHENEIAQAESAGKPFAHFWIHNGLLTVNGEKMSKSVGNVVTVDQALQACKGDADILKTLFLGTHYRSPIDYSLTNLKSATKRFDLWYHFFYLGRYPTGEHEPVKALPELETVRSEFIAAMDSDLNTPKALAALDKIATLGHSWCIDLNELSDESSEARHVKGKMRLASELLYDLSAKIFGLQFARSEAYGRAQLRDFVEELMRQREDARRRGDYRTADGLRGRIHKLGFIVEDTPKGPQLIPAR